MNYLKKLYGILIACILFSNLNSQISKGGLPYSFKNGHIISLNSHIISPPSNNEIQSAATNDKTSYKVGILLNSSISLINNGKWIQNSDGSRSCFLKIESSYALGLSLYFKEFFLPEGSELFIYNENKKHIIGKFNSITNNINQLTHTQIVQGDKIIIEYYEPKNTIETLKVEIEKIGYYFRGFEDYLNPFQSFNDNTSVSNRADFCQVDVACSPENIGWSEQIDAVVHFTYTDPNFIYVCSGSVINNTNQDCKPYILTAWHCGEPTANLNLNGYTWYWNYQKTSCQPNSNSSNPSKGNQTMINGMVKATSGSGTLNNPPASNQVAGSDFTLIELNSAIPTTYNAFYAGWDRGNLSSSGVGIHHPDGSAKKISTYTSNLSSTTYNGGAFNAHWNVYWTATINGHGITEGGSSGSPLFNQNKRIVGQLSGGTTFCSTPNTPDLYGKFSTNWTNNGTSAQSQLEPWLDPNGINLSYLEGTYSPCGGNSLGCDISLFTDSITEGEVLDFYGSTNANSANWSWNFDVAGLGGVTPTSSNNQNPTSILFSNSGLFDVRLTVTSGQSNCTVDTVIKVIPIDNTGILNSHFEEILIFPNPNNGVFTITSKNISSINGGIYNQLGQSVLKFENLKSSSGQFEFNLKTMKPGWYFLKLKNHPEFFYKIIISNN